MRPVENHRVVTRLNKQAAGVQGVLMVGERRGFYLDVPHWSDISLKAFQAIALAPDAAAARRYLAERRMSHVLVNTTDLLWYGPYDPEGRVVGWLARFEATSSGYLEVVDSHEGVTLYWLIGPAPDVTPAGHR